MLRKLILGVLFLVPTYQWAMHNDHINAISLPDEYICTMPGDVFITCVLPHVGLETYHSARLVCRSMALLIPCYIWHQVLDLNINVLDSDSDAETTVHEKFEKTLTLLERKTLVIKALTFKHGDPDNERDPIRIAHMLKSNSTLTFLDLSCLGIRMDKLLPTLTEALKVNKSLETLDLQGNYISDSGMELLGESLQNNSILRKLDLSTDSISDLGALRFLELLQENKTLHHVILAKTGIVGEMAYNRRTIL